MTRSSPSPDAGPAPRQLSGCMVCGAELVYAEANQTLRCAYCAAERPGNVTCAEGHFVCDACHAGDAAAVIAQACAASDETDLLALLRQLRALPAISMHGPEHHGLVPAVVLTGYRNLGGEVSDAMLRTVIDRGLKIPGGFCGHAGACGAAIGVGIAFAALLGSSPVKAAERAQSLNVTSILLDHLARQGAARCCQRDSYLALQKAAELSADLLPITLRAEARWPCAQHARNKQCLGAPCPLHPEVD